MKEHKDEYKTVNHFTKEENEILARYLYPTTRITVAEEIVACVLVILMCLVMIGFTFHVNGKKHTQQIPVTTNYATQATHIEK